MTNCHILLNVAVALIVVIVGFGRGEELEPIPNLVEEEESHVVEKLPLPPPEHEDGRCRCVCPRLSALLVWVPTVVSLTSHLTLVVAYLSWYDFGNSTVCPPVLLGKMGIWQNRLGNCVRWWNLYNKRRLSVFPFALIAPTQGYAEGQDCVYWGCLT